MCALRLWGRYLGLSFLSGALLLCGCISPLVEPFLTEVPTSDGTGPSISALSNVCLLEVETLGCRQLEPGIVYRVGFSLGLVRLAGFAGDPESGIREVTGTLSLDIRCRRNDGFEVSRPYSDSSTATSTARAPGTLVLAAAGSGPVDLVPVSVVESTCGELEFIGFSGVFRVTGTNHSGLSATEEYQLNSVICGRLGDPCCEYRTSDGGRLRSCASDGECRDDLCRVPCDEGDPCTAEGQVGECRSGRWSCTTFSRTCEPRIPMVEACNGRDDDCDGIIDNLPEEPCSHHPPECHEGFAVPGQTRCDDGEEACQPSEEYCSSTGGDCGRGPFDGRCGPDFSGGSETCRPGYQCQRDEFDDFETCQLNRTCPSLPPSNACWFPADVGNACWEP